MQLFWLADFGAAPATRDLPAFTYLHGYGGIVCYINTDAHPRVDGRKLFQIANKVGELQIKVAADSLADVLDRGEI